MKEMSLVAALKDYFGYQPGQSLGGFMTEVKALDETDKAYFRKEFLKVGYKIA